METIIINSESFLSICRVCMEKGSLTSIFALNKKYSVQFSKMLHDCATIEANEGDNLPPNICLRCKTTLVAFYKFQRTATNSERTFRQILIDAVKPYLGEPRIDDSKAEKCNILTPAPLDCDLGVTFSTNPSANATANNKFTKCEFKFEETEEGNNPLSPMPPDYDLDLNLADAESSDASTIDKTSSILEDLKPVVVKGLKTESVLLEIPVDDVKTNTLKSLNNPVQPISKKKRRTGKRQLKEKLAEKSNQCEVCGKFLSCRSNLVQHMRRHTGEKPFECDLCSKRFARAEHVTIHRRIHTGERPHVCTVCHKSFVQYAALTAHLRTHSGERPHMCAICGKSFSQSVSLTYHTRTHTGETPFKCKICHKGFAHSGNLNIHMRFHRNERPFVCNVCGRRFVTSSHLTVHIKQHTGDRPHQCNLCGKAFARSEHLKDHLVIHTGQKPHACKLCPKRYTQSSHLNRHMKTHKS